MSTLETNSIGKYNGNNVSIDDALRLKSYTTTQRDALTSVAGDTIYNTTTSKIEFYDGSAWQTITADTDVKTKVSSNDTTAGFLNGKLVAGSNVTLTEGSDGGNETLTIAATDNSIPFAIALGG